MSDNTLANRAIDVHGLARVEGEGSLHVRIAGGELESVELEIFEPPRFFEAFLRGRGFEEPPDITARICGICPVAYQMSACNAIEDACGVKVTPEISELRRLLYCGEWIQSHALHVYLLHAPDFFGFEDAVELAAADRSAVERGLRLKKAGNAIMERVGGRAIHPVNVRVGGFYRAPDTEEMASLAPVLRQALDDALETVEWVSGFEFPDASHDYLFAALVDEARYAIESGTIHTTDGLKVSAGGFLDLVTEEHVQRSSALHAKLRGKDTYLTGPLARYALSSAKLPPLAAEAAHRSQLGEVCRNPFKSIVVRSVEIVAACEEALRLVESYSRFDPPSVRLAPRAATGAGATEAPRGLLLQRYAITEDGLISDARIMPPTSQNQDAIEDDLRGVIASRLEWGDDDLRDLCEQAVRNHDPCISCAAHFLDLSVEHK
ncbi:MAG: nickel-dependent hydrogenase large subunit [Acidimicrobiales bacterium]